MSQKDDSENEIWGYKPLEKKKKRHESPSEPARVSKRRCISRKTSKTDTYSSAKSPHNKVETEIKHCCVVASSSIDVPQKSSSARGTTTTDSDAEGPSGGFCPVCQMPFSILLMQTQRWHVAECLDIQRETCKECPNGLRCSSTIPNHYRKFNHTVLAQCRANNETALIVVSQQAGTSRKASPGCLPELIIDSDVGGSNLDTSQSNLSVLSNDSASTQNTLTGTPPSKLSNGLLLLRSPGPEDFKKKKGWSPSPKNQKAVSVSQESRKDLSSSPVKAESGRKACQGLLQGPPSPEIDDAISYSPLSEFPADIEAANSKFKKCLFNNDASENEREDSVLLFGDGFSSEDELLNEFLDHFEANNVQVKEPASSVTQLDSVALAPPTNQIASSSGADHRVESTGDKEAHGRSTCLMGPCKNSIQSPHRIVLERLRETLQSSDSLHLKDLTVSSVGSDQRHAASSKVPSSQTPTVQRSETMSPQKGQSKAGQASCLKQTDIGVFFGLKPLKKQEKEAQGGPHELNTASIPVLDETSRRRQREPRKERQGKSKADTAADPSQSTDHSNVANAGKGRSRAWGGRRWNRVNADGEVELPRCPFYKKIPGTKFVIDAFHYGDIEGVAAYFLTHFHWDHYGGLTKNSTLPIYCNRITGNLVKSKLKVAEQYVHILPMNTQVTVEGVKVILLDANHCPGAAMLLFFLPDGQTVLHTGDFRADPSMETYPELISCRVQTLYLDTTYCSPEYTFPRQQEVIRFAASTAFECVTLNPRTLVVCGSYSVGKEKVFLALAEVLGTKVCLSRDKFNTMCCLESEQVRRCITTDWKAAQVHVLPMMQLTFKKLQDHLSRFSGQYDRLVAFKPTGWTFSQQVDSVGDIQPQISGNISIYGVPYSEHSSFLEMKRFVQWLRPLKIIPTVNNGSWTSRKAMEKNFSEWLLETKAKL